MKQWPTAARRWHFALRDVSCRQSWDFYWINLRLKAFFLQLTTVAFPHCEKALEKIKTRAYIRDWEIVCLCTRCYRSTLFSMNWKNYKKNIPTCCSHFWYIWPIWRFMAEIWLSVQCLAFKEHRGQIFKTAKNENLIKEDIQLLNSICKVFLLVAKDKNEIEGTVWFFLTLKRRKICHLAFFICCVSRDAKGAVARVVFTYFSIKASLGDYVQFLRLC